MSRSERKKELQRRRHRKLKIARFTQRATKASFSERAHLAAKIRSLTPGGEQIIERLSLEDR